MKRVLSIAIFAVMIGETASSCGDSSRGWSHRIADAFLIRHPGAVTYDSASPNTRWNYEQGLMLRALLAMWRHTGEERYFDFVRKNLDRYILSDGTISSYKMDDYNLDNIAPGAALLEVFQRTREDKYRLAAEALRRQLLGQPRTSEGGFWHKKIYPFQMWLDGLYMAEPFYARYAAMFQERKAFDDISEQFLLAARHTRDPGTGLLYHAWDERRSERWADSATGCSRNFWGRALGWYMMALVDVLDDLPTDHPRRGELIGILRDLSGALIKVRDEHTSLYHQVLDQGDREGNYLEASSSAMFVYAFAKGVRKGYLDGKFLAAARDTFRGITGNLVRTDAGGLPDLDGTCRSAGLGGVPYRDGSYGYYVGEGVRMNDMKGLGAFLMAALELEESAG